jgi:hypothetical protein
VLKNLTRMGVVSAAFMELPHDSSREGAAFTGNLSESKFRRGPLRSRHRLKGQTDTVQKDLRQNPWAKSKSATRPETNCRKPHLPSGCSKCPVGRAHRMSGDQSTLPAYVLYFNADPSSDEALRLHSAGVLSAACVPGNENEQPCHDAFLSLWPT